MPANQMDLQGYARFLTACANDRRFNAVDADRRDREGEPGLRLLREPALPLLRDPAHAQTAFSSVRRRTPGSTCGRRRGRAASTPSIPTRCCCKIDIDERSDASAPSICRRCGISASAAGCGCTGTATTISVEERNKSAAIGAGATPDSLDLTAMARIEDWILDLKPPAYPRRSHRRGEGGAGRRDLSARVRQLPRRRRRRDRPGHAAGGDRHRPRARRLVHRGARRRA